MKLGSKTSLLTKSASIVALAAVMVPATAVAQLDEIVVTAQKRAESLTDVPVAVTAYTGERLEDLGINDASDLIQITPGLQSNQQSGSNRNYFLRGVGTFDFHLTAASAVGQYFDDITLTSGFHARAALFDMERVEVLKGPQNTLFGLNTTGGAINYISKKPSINGAPTGYGKATVGNDSQTGLEGAIGLDNGRNVAFRGAVYYNQHDGPFESNLTGVDHGDEDFVGYRGTLLWEVGERTDLNINIHGSESDNNGPGTPALGTRDPSNRTQLCSEFGNMILDFGSFTDCTGRNGNLNGAAPTNPSTGDFEVTTQNLGNEDLKTIGYYAKLNHEMAFATLTLSAAFDNLDLESSIDGDGGPTTLLDLNQAEDRDTAQYEARLVSNGDGAFRWIGGVFYLDEEADSYTGVISPGIGGGLRIANVQLDHSKENFGVYAQGEYDITDRLTLTAGVRYSEEDIVGDYLPSSPNASGFLGTPIYQDLVNQLVRDQFGAGAPGHNPAVHDENGFELSRQVQNSLSNEDVGYTVKLDYALTDESLIYASVSEGFKGGALDIRAAFALVPPANIEASLAMNTLDPESLQSFEVGYKGTFWNNQVQVDVAAFHYTYDNLQQFITAGGVPQLDNAPESEIMGLDGNIKYANDSGFYADLGFSLLDTEVTDATDSNFVEGTDLGRAPDFKISALAAQEFTVGGNTLTVLGSVVHTDDQLTGTPVSGTINADLANTEPSYTLVNANISYAFGADEQYKFSVFGNNLTDENFCGARQINNGNFVVDPAGFAGGLNANAICRTSRNATQTYGVSLSVNF